MKNASVHYLFFILAFFASFQLYLSQLLSFGSDFVSLLNHIAGSMEGVFKCRVS